MDIMVLGKKIEEIAVFVGSCLVALLGGLDNLISFLFIVMAVDVFLGVGIALYQKNFSRQKIFLGGFKKIAEVLVVVIANQADVAFGTDIWRMGACLYYSGYEGLSVARHMSVLDLPLPKALKSFFERLNAESDNPDKPTDENIDGK